MNLTATDIAQMIDLSCVRTKCCKKDINDLVVNARKYQIGQVSVLQCFIPYAKNLIKNDQGIRLVGNVSFPAGSDSTSMKIFQTKELTVEGCDEIDMVINVGKLRSGEYTEVTNDIKAVVETAFPIPVKVIIETPFLTSQEIKKACVLCINSGAAFVKTGTGWAEKGTTLEDIKLIKSIVGNKIKIKASGGIRDARTLIEMYKLGARRFGVNLNSGVQIMEECINNKEILAGIEKN